MKLIFTALYYLVFIRIPSSHNPGGNIYNSLRLFCIRRIFDVGVNSKVQKNIYFGKGRNIEIGSNCQLNENIRLDNVVIGDNVMIARDTVFLGKTHDYSRIDIPMNEQPVLISAPTVVKNDVWIGIRSIILPGVLIEKGCVIAAGTVLTKDTVPYGVYGGVPGKLIKIRKNYL